ncbi:hypothetical protein DM860_009440 [Cuscuta australis]|uniref:Uncharacterized protein n=1 Tax=Cuscuta australis TaxID=267555 RepID=A0A328DJF3_9ASTE|nr:hypothetical protein DM860_009440 [Cuscuta australis]
MHPSKPQTLLLLIRCVCGLVILRVALLFYEWLLCCISSVFYLLAHLQRANVRKEVFHKSKLHAEDAFERKNYAIAAGWYNTAIKESPCDATLLSRRSLCYSLAGCGNAALSDAQACVCLRERITQMQ